MANRTLILFALIIAIGIAISGFSLGMLYNMAHKPINFVSVKGMAERDVEADYSNWQIQYVTTDNDLTAAQGKIEGDRKKILAFLLNNGIKESEVKLQFFDVSDQAAQAYRNGPVESRYILTQVLLVQTTNVNAVEQAAKNISDLVSDGIIISGDKYTSGPDYIYDKLNDLKPQLLAEATKNARASAEQFAKDSGAQIGNIKTANQGAISITSPLSDENTRESKFRNKKVRVVSTIEYYLNN